jgi:agmatine deiminase
MGITKQRIRLPAEWEPQSAILLTWPHAYTDWHSQLTEIENVFLDIAFHITLYQSLIIVCFDDEHRTHIQQQFLDKHISTERCHFFIAPSNDSWVRDHGPVTVLHDQLPMLLNFTFNGWGLKYPCELDNAITSSLYAAGAFSNTPIEDIDFILEGGNLESDGQGTLLAGQQCLFSEKRNPNLTPIEIEDKLKQLTGVVRILCLKNGQISGDDTDGHIDTLARFVNRETIVYVSCDDRNHPDYSSLKLMEDELNTFRQLNGNPYSLRRLPLPGPITNDSNEYLPPSYANFLIINEAVLLPQYNVKEDYLAAEIIGECFPDRKVIGINCLPLIGQFGSLHCVTMQLPINVI